MSLPSGLNEKGVAWANQAIAARLKSGSLPNLGRRGDSPRYLAAHAIQRVAEGKMGGGRDGSWRGMVAGGQFADVPLRDFWRTVQVVCAHIKADEAQQNT